MTGLRRVPASLEARGSWTRRFTPPRMGPHRGCASSDMRARLQQSSLVRVLEWDRPALTERRSGFALPLVILPAPLRANYRSPRVRRYPQTPDDARYTRPCHHARGPAQCGFPREGSHNIGRPSWLTSLLRAPIGYASEQFFNESHSRSCIGRG